MDALFALISSLAALLVSLLQYLTAAKRKYVLAIERRLAKTEAHAEKCDKQLERLRSVMFKKLTDHAGS